jgi:hypothetical protein
MKWTIKEIPINPKLTTQKISVHRNSTLLGVRAVPQYIPPSARPYAEHDPVYIYAFSDEGSDLIEAEILIAKPNDNVDEFYEKIDTYIGNCVFCDYKKDTTVVIHVAYLSDDSEEDDDTEV